MAVPQAQRVSNPTRALPAPGDIVVTRVSRHYHINRVLSPRQPLKNIDVTNERVDAVALACRLVTGSQRVFFYDRASSRDFVEIG
jgi:hypothetical protein